MPVLTPVSQSKPQRNISLIMRTMLTVGGENCQRFRKMNSEGGIFVGRVSWRYVCQMCTHCALVACEVMCRARNMCARA
jgi:hypothetical protein